MSVISFLRRIYRKSQNIQSPYSYEDTNAPEVLRNMEFLRELEDSLKDHSVFDHPFLLKLAAGSYSGEVATLVFAQFAKIVKPFTAALSALMGRSPDLKSRTVLFDNLFEEMGGGKIEQSHPLLYLNMMKSMGIDEKTLEDIPAISSVRLLNDALFDAILHKPFHVGCAWLGFGGELTIPNNFPYLAAGIESSFPHEKINLDFF